MNSRQAVFVAEYLIDGNATQAAIRAGYSIRTAYSQGQRLLKNVKVLAAIQRAQKERTSALIADRQARQVFWTQIMLDGDTAVRDRLKASELLGKSEGDFTERVKADISPSGYDLAKLKEEELLALRELLTKAI